MAKRKKKKNRAVNKSRSKDSFFDKMKSHLFNFIRATLGIFPAKAKRQILASFIILISVIIFLSFFKAAGAGGNAFFNFLFYWIGQAIYFIPLVFIVLGISVLYIPKKFLGGKIVALLIFIIGLSGLLTVLNIKSISGGVLGRNLSFPLIQNFGVLVASAAFFILTVLGISISWYLISPYLFVKEEEKETAVSKAIKKVISFPQFKVSKIEGEERLIPQKSESGKKESVSTPISVSSKQFILPPLDLLLSDGEKAHSGDIKQNALIIKKTLENFGIEVLMDEVNIGPTVTQYTLKPAEGVKLSKITGLSNNLALALAAHPIRIEAPIPGKSLVGIEVPNKVRSKVRLRALLNTPDFQKAASKLTFVLGRDVAGNPFYGDLARLPHLLVAGATGTGKTIFLNSFILSLLYQNSPQDLRFILVDPKRVEFPVYNDLPHLLCPVVLDHDRATNALKWMVQEMERRFSVLFEARAKDIISFNEKARKKNEPVLPYIVLIIDELADLMAARGKEIEASIVRIAQMARAVGIHLVLATQRPSVEVITGLIKANITSRISFQVATQFDSRTVLDMAGSEKLLGLGDMLYISAEIIKPKRIQGAFVSEEETKNVVSWIIKQQKPDLYLKENDLASGLEESMEKAAGTASFDGERDSLYEEAKQIVLEHRRASASLLQRRLSIGYARAARLLDTLESEGVIGPAQGAKPRRVLIKPETQDNASIEESFE